MDFDDISNAASTAWDGLKQGASDILGGNGDPSVLDKPLVGQPYTDSSGVTRDPTGMAGQAVDNFLLTPLGALTRETFRGDTGTAGDGETHYDPTKNGGGMLNPINMATNGVQLMRSLFGADHNDEAMQLDADVKKKVYGP